MMHQPVRGRRGRGVDPMLILAFLTPIFAWAPFTSPGYFVFESGFLPIFNLSDRLAHIADPGWLPLVGRSHSLLAGEGPLPYLLAALPAALGLGPTGAVKLVFALSLIAASLGAFLWLRRVLRESWPALVGAVVCIYNPLTLAVAFRRGALAEAVVVGLMPFVLLAAECALVNRRWLALVAVLLAAVFWSQVGLGLGLALILAAYLFFRVRAGEDGRARWAVAGLAAGLALAAAGLLPALIRNGTGSLSLAGVYWPLLLAPWLALAGGWAARRLAAMAGEAGQAVTTPLYAGLVVIALLVVHDTWRPIVTDEPPPPAPLAIYGENEIALLGVETEGSPAPGGRVTLEARWQALRPLTRDYTVFFHVVGPDDQRYAQLDTMPQAGERPTTGWQPGEVVTDRYEVVLPVDAPPGPYRCWVGWYFGETGERLRTGDDDKYVVTP